MTDPEIVLRKLTVLRDHLERARRRRPDDLARLLGDDVLQDALSMSLLVAVQEAIDIAFHIATDQGWGVPASNAEAFGLLAEHAVLSVDLARALGGVAALRNRIAHGYASVDLARLWTELPAGLDVLEQYVQEISRELAAAKQEG